MANVTVTRFPLGHIPWNKGLVGVQVSTRKGKKCRKHTDEEKIKIGLTMQKEKHWNWKGGKPKCSDCGKTLSGYKNKKCSHCKGLRGELSPRWKGGLRGDDYLQRRRFRFIMQKQVFERDNYMCQLCGAKGDLQVDHIQSWADYVELRFCIDNCRTLCKSCHYQITYGRPIPDKSMEWGHNLGKARIEP